MSNCHLSQLQLDSRGLADLTPLFEFCGQLTLEIVKAIIAEQASLYEQQLKQFKERLELKNNPIACFICRDYSHQVFVLCQCQKCHKQWHCFSNGHHSNYPQCDPLCYSIIVLLYDLCVGRSVAGSHIGITGGQICLFKLVLLVELSLNDGGVVAMPPLPDCNVWFMLAETLNETTLCLPIHDIPW